MNSLQRKEVLKDAEDYAASLRDEDDAIGIDGDGDDTNEDQSVSAFRNKSVEQHHKWKQKAYKGMPGGSDERSKFVSNHTHYSTTDPDARVSVKPGKARQLNYHAQVAVDTASHVITNIESHTADKKDSQCLPSVLTSTVNNLKENGLLVEEVLCDAGYSSGEALKALEQHNITGYIPNFGQYKAVREGFTYHEQGDYYECSMGAKLQFKKIHYSHDQYGMRHYRSSSKDCRQCPLKPTCIGKSNEKKIEVTVDKPLYDRMHERLQSSYAKRMKKVRSSSVEPVLGTLVNFLAMRRVNTRGLKASNKCILMAAVAYNLKKLMKFKSPDVIAMVKTIEKQAGKSYQNIFFLFTTLMMQYRIKNNFLKAVLYSHQEPVIEKEKNLQF